MTDIIKEIEPVSREDMAQFAWDDTEPETGPVTSFYVGPKAVIKSFKSPRDQAINPKKLSYTPKRYRKNWEISSKHISLFF